MFDRITIVLLVAVFLWAVLVRDTGAGHAPVSYRVRTGDSLWSIAANRYGGDPREAVWKLENSNHLKGTTIVPGQVLKLP